MNPLRIADFDYNLPDTSIANYPLSDRTQSKLLRYEKGEISDFVFAQLPELLKPDDVLVFNNTKVVKARLIFQNANGARIEIFCLEPYEKTIEQAMEQQGESCWKCLIGNAKRWKNPESLKLDFYIELEKIELEIRRVEDFGGESLIEFKWNMQHFSFSQLLEHLGKIPLPPYIKRDAEAADSHNYQTCYAQVEGSVAAPTAGLHFTPELLSQIDARGVKRLELTLHVGAGTFKPVKSEVVSDHEMHAEQYAVSKDVLESLISAIQNGQRIIAVGTTSCRTLESLYWLGLKALNGKLLQQGDCYTHQWEPYEVPKQNAGVSDAFGALHNFLHINKLTRLEGKTGIMLMPGYPYQVIQGLVTNFHQPKSTLMLLVAAFIGEDWRKIYTHALENNYRFLSYGDGSLLVP